MLLIITAPMFGLISNFLALLQNYRNGVIRMGLNAYEPSGFALQIFQDRYALHEDENFEKACWRVARFIANVEEGENS